MLEAIVLGVVQGIAEWLPVSSEAMIVLVQKNFFGGGTTLYDSISFAIFLHLGTLLAAVVYFRKDIVRLLYSFIHYSHAKEDERSLLWFIIVTTGISGLLGLFVLEFVRTHEAWFSHTANINFIVSLFLMVTAALLFIGEQRGRGTRTKASLKDAVVTGTLQGFSAIPGVSRSGSTIAAMGILGFDRVWALRISFILSIPLVLLANIVLNAKEIMNLTGSSMVALLSAFIVGYLGIHILLKLVERVRFSTFVSFFAVMLLAAALLG